MFERLLKLLAESLIKNPNLDTQYIEKWLREFDKTTGKDLFKKFKDAIK